jgi:hypothetical protein
MDIRKHNKVLFPVACGLLVVFSFGFDSFKSDFSLPTFFALFGLLLIEVLLFVIKSDSLWWNRIKWLLLAGITLIILIG